MAVALRQALNEKIQVERGSALRGVRTCAAAAQNMAAVANSCARGAEIDTSAEISTRRMKVRRKKLNTVYRHWS